MTLGCPDDYMVALHWRRGERVFTQLGGVTSVEWQRRLSETAEATVEISKRDAGGECCGRLARTFPWIHEVTVYRAGELVWQGPLTTLTETRTGFTLQAQDVTGWLHARPMFATYNTEGERDLADVAFDLVDHAIRPAHQAPGDDGGDNERVMQDLIKTPTGLTTPWEVERMSKNAYDALTDITDLGVDFTTVGRSLRIGPEATPDSPAQARLTDRDFLDDLEIEINGTDAATGVWAVGKDNIAEHVGGWTRMWDLLDRMVRNEDVEERAALRHIASTRQRGAFPPLVLVRIPDRAQLAPTAPAGARQLVCGERFDVVMDGFCRPVAQGLRLSQLQVSWGPNRGERVQVSMVPLRGEEVPGEGGDFPDSATREGLNG